MTIMDSTKLTEFAADNFRSDGNGINFSYRPEHTVGKGEVPRQERFHLSRNIFQRLKLQTLMTLCHAQTGACLGKG